MMISATWLGILVLQAIKSFLVLWEKSQNKLWNKRVGKILCNEKQIGGTNICKTISYTYFMGITFSAYSGGKSV